MRKILLITILIVFIIGFFSVIYFYWKNYQGMLLVLKKPQQNIAQLLQEATGSSQPISDLPLSLPEGFSISVLVKNLDKPRTIIIDQEENILVSLPDEGKIIVLQDNDDTENQPLTILDNLPKPHGLKLYCPESEICRLFVACEKEVFSFSYDPKKLTADTPKKLFDLPGGEGHWTRSLEIIQEDDQPKLLISIGSSCNVCKEDDWRRAKILSANLDGSNLQEFTGGLRNAVFLTTHPTTGDIWTTEMGRDFLGDNLPPDEINVIKKGADYGWPYCYGDNIHDTDFDPNHKKNDPCIIEKTPSYINIPAHSAPLGLAFFPQNGWPIDMQYDLLVAYHSSWNKTTPTGYKIVRYRLDPEGKFIIAQDFITGWLSKNNEVYGRPVGIAITENGKIYISDDKAGVIYKVIYKSR